MALQADDRSESLLADEAAGGVVEKPSNFLAYSLVVASCVGASLVSLLSSELTEHRDFQWSVVLFYTGLTGLLTTLLWWCVLALMYTKDSKMTVRFSDDPMCRHPFRNGTGGGGLRARFGLLKPHESSGQSECRIGHGFARRVCPGLHGEDRLVSKGSSYRSSRCMTFTRTRRARCDRCRSSTS